MGAGVRAGGGKARRGAARRARAHRSLRVSRLIRVPLCLLLLLPGHRTPEPDRLAAEQPTIRIQGPEDLGRFGEYITVTGWLLDGRTDAAGTARIRRAGWSVPGTDQSGPLPYDSEGRFSLRLDAPQDRMAVYLETWAEHANGTLATDTRVLLRTPAGVVLQLDTPREGQHYREDIVVEGRLDGGLTEVRSLTWSIPGTDARGPVMPGPDGRFSFPVGTERLRGPVVFRVAAALRDGGVLERLVALRDGISAPGIEVSLDAATYGETLGFSGVVSQAGGPAVLDWAVRGTSLAGQLLPSADGAFTASIPSQGRRGAVTVDLTAHAQNGQSATRTLVLFEQSRPAATASGPGDAGGAAAPEQAWIALLSEDDPYADVPLPEPPSPLEPGQPWIGLVAPVDGGAYGSHITIRGVVRVGGQPDLSALKELRLNVGPTIIQPESVPLETTVSVRPDGVFELVAPTSGFRGDQRVAATVATVDGATARAVATITRSPDAVAGFSVQGEDASVVATWPPVPLARRYSIRVGNADNADTYQDVHAPYRAANLVNGELYRLRLVASLTTGETISSGEVEVIPLSVHTLQPQVTGEYRRIRLSWPAIPGTQQYEVWRSLQGGDDERRIAQTAEPRYLDKNVAFGRVYSYSVAASRGSLRSEASTAGTTAFPADRFTREASLYPGAPVLALAVDRNYAYLACGPAGLVIVEVRDAANPRIVARVATADARDVVLTTLPDGHRYAVVADGDRGAVLVDVSVPAEPVVTGSRVTTDAQALAVVSDREYNLVYVADGASGIKVIDLAVPRRPERVASLSTADARALFLRRPYLYAAGADGLTVLEIGNPASPVLVSQVSVPGAVGLAGDPRGGTLYLYVAGGSYGLSVYDASDPRRPRLAADYAARNASAVAVSTHAYVTDASGGFVVLDMTDPTRPELFDTVATPPLQDISFEDRSEGEHFIYAAGRDGLEIVQVLVDGRSLELGSFATGDRGYTVELAELGTPEVWAVVADHGRGVRMLELANLGTPGIAGSGFRMPSTYAYDTAVAQIAGRGWHVLVADGQGGLKLFDVSTRKDPDGPPFRLAGSAFAADARSVTTLGTPATVALVADSRDGLRIFDITRPEAVRQLALVAAPGTRDVAVAQSAAAPPLALLADGDSVQSVDLATPGSPQRLGRLTLAGARRVAVVDGALRLFAVIAGRGVALVDAASPESPRLLGTYSTEFGEDLHVADPRAAPARLYVAEGHLGLTILDVADSRSLRRVSSFPDIYAVGVAGRAESPEQMYAYAVDTARVWQVRILVPGWLGRARAR